MNNKSILIKLAKIASNQHKILTKLVLAINSSDEELLEDLSGPDTEREPWLENQMISIEHGNNLLNKGVESDLPPDFEKHFSFHKERGDRFSEDYYDGEFPFGHVVRQLKLLSEGDPYMWGQVGSAYKGWTPAHVAKLLKRLNEHNGNFSDISESDDEQPDTVKDPFMELTMKHTERGHTLMDEGVKSDFPPGFEQKLLLHKTRSGERPQDYEPVEDPYAEYDELTGGHVVRQLKLLSAGDPYMWNLIGKAYKGWTPEHVAKLLKKINEHNRYE